MAVCFHMTDHGLDGGAASGGDKRGFHPELITSIPLAKRNIWKNHATHFIALASGGYLLAAFAISRDAKSSTR
jgi:hypothetical protein